MCWAEVPTRPTVLIPLGSTEQHGPHLPCDTDTAIATATARAIAAAVAESTGVEVLVAPAIAYGSSGEHQSFPGTASIGHEALALMLIELVRSVMHWAGRIVFINGHGGNVTTLAAVVRQMIAEQHNVAWAPCMFETTGDAHAGFDETSVMLHLDPDRVQMDRVVKGNTEPLDQLLPELIANGVSSVSPNGVLGDPTRANAESGAGLFERLVENMCAWIVAGKVDPNGRLTADKPHAGAPRGGSP